MRALCLLAAVMVGMHVSACGLYPPLTVAADGGRDVIAGDVAADTSGVDTPPAEAGVDPMASCGTVGGEGGDRDCGWVVRTVLTCTPGTTVVAGCSTECGVGVCPNDGTSDTVLRICGCNVPCTLSQALAQNDNSECTTADSATDECSIATFTCPSCGMFTAIAGGYFELRPITCQIGTQ